MYCELIEMEDLKKCPFCGNTVIRMVKRPPREEGFRNRYFALCDYRDGGCGAAGGEYHTMEEAKAWWNQRRRKWKRWDVVGY